MIRQGRLEWRAEVAAADLGRIEPGTRATVVPASGTAIEGTVRMVAPTVDPQTRLAIVYVDLPKPGGARAGMFARGELDLGSSSALTLPASAVQMREGFSYVFQVAPDSKVRETKITVGRRAGDRVEVTAGLAPDARVVVSGGGFLADGDTVRVVPAPASTAAAVPAAASGSAVQVARP
jgi:RND family efflux transporter MFP subunit